MSYKIFIDELYTTLKNKIDLRKLASISIVFGGHFSLFISNFLFKYQLDKFTFGVYSFLVTFFSIVIVYGALGLEQTLIKYSHYDKKIIIDKFILYIIGVSSVLSTIFFSYYLFFNLNFDNLTLFLGILCTFCISTFIFFFNIYRLNFLYIKSQLLFHSWKFILLILFIFIIFKFINFNELLNLLFLSVIILTIITIIDVLIGNQIKIVNNSIDKKTLINHSVFYFLSISSFTFLTFADRLFLIQKGSLESFSEYFFYSTILLFPYSILSNLVHFFNVNKYKLNFSLTLFYKDLKNSLIVGIIISLIIILVIYNFSFFNNNNVINFSIFWLVILLGVLRLISTPLYLAFEIIVDNKNFQKANIIFIIITVLYLFYVYLFINNLFDFLITLITLWTVRFFINYYFLLKFVNK